MGVTEADLFVGLGSVAWLFSFQRHGEEFEEVKSPIEAKPEIQRGLSEKGVKRAKHESVQTKTAASINTWTGLDTPLEESEIEAQLDLLTRGTGKLYTHANDSAISMPGEFPFPETLERSMTPPSTPSRRSSAATDMSEEVQQVSTDVVTPPSSPSQAEAASPKEATKSEDPTMDFSTLLIAKPMPFKFNLRVRSRARAEQVTSKWLQLKMDGEFEDARVYWADGKSTAGDAEFGWGEVFS